MNANQKQLYAQEHPEMCKTLGVRVLPFFQFFHGAQGKVEQFSCSISKLQKFRVS